jgi:hypothetical protein
MNRRTLSFCIVTLMIAAPLPAQTLTVKAFVSPTNVLPGLPAAFSLMVTNSSPTVQTVLDGVRLHVTRENETFTAGFAENDSFNFPATTHCASEACITLTPGMTKTIYFDFRPTLDANPFFMDERLSVPGVYTLQFELYVDHQSAGVESVLSPTATFTITTPTGADAAFWMRMQGSTGHQRWSAVDWTEAGRRLASEIYGSPTDTAYLPWLAGLVQGTLEQRIAAYDLALGKNIPSALRDALLYGKAAALNGASANAVWSEFNVDAALKEADMARAALKQLIQVTTVDVVREQASELLGQLLTPQSANDLLRSRIAIAPPAPLPVRPEVNCVTRGNGNTFSATFGYTNPNKAGKILLINDDNQVTPAPRDQGQPRYFLPGDHAKVFTASSPGGDLKWHLDGSQVTATADFPVQCTAQP